ncbi:DUF6438 domain-containing protein [Bacteroidota bacterium]
MKYIPLIFLFTLACKSSFNITNIESKEPLIILEKTSCRGKCPVYKASFYDEGVIILNAKENFKYIGKHYKKIEKAEMKELVGDFVKADFFSFEDKYTSRKTDLPTTFVTFNYEGKSKRILDYSDAPRELNELENKLKTIIEGDDWIKME